MGAIAGAAATAGSGNAKGMLVGAFLGLASNFIGSGASAIGTPVLQAVIGGGRILLNNAAAMPTVAPKPQGVTSTGGTRGGPNRGNSPIGDDENNSGPGDLYTSLDAAAIGFYNTYKKALSKKSVEYSAVLYSITGEDNRRYYSYTEPQRFDDDDEAKRASPGLGNPKFNLPSKGGAKEVTIIHFHWDEDSGDPHNPGNEDFSGGDNINHNKWNVDVAYLITPTIRLKVWRRNSNGPGMLLAFSTDGITQAIQDVFEYSNGSTYKSLNELKPVNIKPKSFKAADPKTYLFPFKLKVL